VKNNSLKNKKLSTSDGTNTMDFIEKMINQDITEDFKIPEYEGIQTSLMKNSSSNRFSQGTLNVENLNLQNEQRLHKMQSEVDSMLQKQK
jgi:hypothetical protein